MKSFLSYPSLLLILFIFAGQMAAAQNDDATAKFLDSLKKPPVTLPDTVIAENDSVSDIVEKAGTAPEEIPVNMNIVSHYRPISADTLARIKRDKGFYYQHWLDSLLRAEEASFKNRKPPRKLNLPNLDVFFTILKIILWLGVAAILVFVIYKLFMGKNALFLTNKKNIDAVIQPAEPLSANQYDTLVKKAEAVQDYRLAVRYRYLQVLYHLSEKGYIAPGTEKTNYQYINEVKKRSAAAAGLFSALTLKYEYTWYGEYPLTEAMYHSLKNDFDHFYKATV